MKDEHITSLLEGAPFARLSERELATIKAHTSVCAACRRAYEAARRAALLLKERAAESVEPSPFFQTRVLAALRERQAGNEGWSFARLWRSAGALVSSMAAVVALLAGLTFLAPASQPTTTETVATVSNPYSTEDVVLAQDEAADEQMTDAQVLTTLYDADDEQTR
jgi:anti-sigma-K factor RskA